jgi:hypothetical protein
MVTLLVRLPRGLDNQSVDATLLSLTPKHVEDFIALWKDPLRQATQEDKYWDWAFKQRLSDTSGNYECYAIECEGSTQGLMMIETQWHRAQFFPGRRLVYVAALSVAPWNRRQIQQPPRFRRVGTVLLNFSRVRSLALGYKGRVGLHALPGAESFYEYRNMMRYEASPDDFINADGEQLTYFEYPASRGQEL